MNEYFFSKKMQDADKDCRAEFFKDISDFAKSEITWIRTAYKFAISLTAFIAATGIFFTYKSAYDFKQEIRDDIERQRIQLASELNQQIKKVGERIEDEFNKENIRKLVEERAKARIDEVASKLISDEITTKIYPQLEIAEKRLEKIQENFAISTNSINELNAISEFTLTVIAAQNDERKAFDKLKNWANDKSYPRFTEAQLAWVRIMDEHTSPFEESGFKVPWKEGINPEKLSLNDLEKDFQSVPSTIRLGLLEYIWKREDIPKKSKMTLLVHILENDESLKVVEYAGRYFLKESKQQFKPLAIEQHLEWWQNNKDNLD